MGLSSTTTTSSSLRGGSQQHGSINAGGSGGGRLRGRQMIGDQQLPDHRRGKEDDNKNDKDDTETPTSSPTEEPDDKNDKENDEDEDEASIPTDAPSPRPVTTSPTTSPSMQPVTSSPTLTPTVTPTVVPTQAPVPDTVEPTASSASPTNGPMSEPTESPTSVVATQFPTVASAADETTATTTSPTQVPSMATVADNANAETYYPTIGLIFDGMGNGDNNAADETHSSIAGNNAESLLGGDEFSTTMTGSSFPLEVVLIVILVVATVGSCACLAFLVIQRGHSRDLKRRRKEAATAAVSTPPTTPMGDGYTDSDPSRAPYEHHTRNSPLTPSSTSTSEGGDEECDESTATFESPPAVHVVNWNGAIQLSMTPPVAEGQLVRIDEGDEEYPESSARLESPVIHIVNTDGASQLSANLPVTDDEKESMDEAAENINEKDVVVEQTQKSDPEPSPCPVQAENQELAEKEVEDAPTKIDDIGDEDIKEEAGQEQDDENSAEEALLDDSEGNEDDDDDSTVVIKNCKGAFKAQFGQDGPDDSSETGSLSSEDLEYMYGTLPMDKLPSTPKRSNRTIGPLTPETINSEEDDEISDFSPRALCSEQVQTDRAARHFHEEHETSTTLQQPDCSRYQGKMGRGSKC